MLRVERSENLSANVNYNKFKNLLKNIDRNDN